MWREIADSINKLLDSFSNPVAQINEVAKNLSKGILNNNLELDAKGDINVAFPKRSKTLNKATDAKRPMMLNMKREQRMVSRINRFIR